MTKKTKKLPIESPFDFTEYVEKQEEENEVDLGLFLELAEENKIIYKQTPVNTLIEDMEKLKNGFFTNGYFSLGDDGGLDTTGFFKDSDELDKFIDKILDKDDDHPSIYYTGNIYRYFRNFKRVNRSDHGKVANEFKKKIKTIKEETVIYLVQTDVFSCVLTAFSGKTLAWSSLSSFNQIK